MVKKHKHSKPYLHIVSSCLSVEHLASVALSGAATAAGCCISTSALATSAPCLTKSTGSSSKGASASSAAPSARALASAADALGLLLLDVVAVLDGGDEKQGEFFGGS